MFLIVHSKSLHYLPWKYFIILSLVTWMLQILLGKHGGNAFVHFPLDCVSVIWLHCTFPFPQDMLPVCISELPVYYNFSSSEMCTLDMFSLCCLECYVYSSSNRWIREIYPFCYSYSILKCYKLKLNISFCRPQQQYPFHYGRCYWSGWARRPLSSLG